VVKLVQKRRCLVKVIANRLSGQGITQASLKHPKLAAFLKAITVLSQVGSYSPYLPQGL
jgi:hypothetical protein